MYFAFSTLRTINNTLSGVLYEVLHNHCIMVISTCARLQLIEFSQMVQPRNLRGGAGLGGRCQLEIINLLFKYCYLQYCTYFFLPGLFDLIKNWRRRILFIFGVL